MNDLMNHMHVFAFFLLLRDIGDVVLDRVSNNLNIEEQASEDIFQGSHASFSGYTTNEGRKTVVEFHMLQIPLAEVRGNLRFL